MGSGRCLTCDSGPGNPQASLSFVNFEGRQKPRINGVASVQPLNPLEAEYPGRVLGNPCFTSCAA